jgi:SNF2 family DNA or RNA helicase
MPPTKDGLRQLLYDTISQVYDVPKERFDQAWDLVDKTGIVDRLIEKKRAKVTPEYEKYSLQELEGMVSDDLAKNNQLALEMIRRPGFDRNLVNELYNGLGVEVEMGSEGTYGEGIILKRKLTLQQFYTSEKVSRIIKEMLMIPEFARIYDPTCGSGRLFWAMPNPEMIHGIEIESNAYNIARALYPKAQIVQDNTMYHLHENVFDYVVGNPPFTMFWEDKLRLFKFTGYANKIISEVAVMESAIRGLRNGGCFAVVMPENVWIDKFYDNEKLINWLKQTVDCIAKVDLPRKTHEGTVYPVSLYIFMKTTDYNKPSWGGYRTTESRMPAWVFTRKLPSFDDADISVLLDEWKDYRYPYDHIKAYSDNITNQGPFKMEVATVSETTTRDYLKTSTKIESDDEVILDTLLKEIDSFLLPPITMIPNGLHADLKINALRSIYGTVWSPSRREYVDRFKEEIATLDGFLDERKMYDNLPLVQGLHQYDCAVKHSKGFMAALEKRKEWMEFQNTPFELWVDENNDFKWKELFADQGYQIKYPLIWKKWKDKFEQMQSDPKYKATRGGREINWLKELFEFQKFDVLRLAMKASAINALQMGLGKTMTSIAVALLKDFDANIIICPARLIPTWQDEFKNLNMTAPYLLEYPEDVAGMSGHQFVICSYETLRSDPNKKRPKARRRENPEGIENQYNYDYPSPITTENDIQDMAEELGIQADSEVMTARKNPEDEGDKEETSESKAQEQARRLATMPLFADLLTGKFGFAIVDEAHSLQNPTTMLTQAVMRVQPKHINLLSGSPIKNRVKGLLSLIILGWGEQTTANPYSKEDFLDTFVDTIETDYETVDSHGFKKKGKKEVEIPQIKNPDELRALMASKWLRRTKYEPVVAKDRKFPVPKINYIEITPSKEEREYAKQWYDEYERLKVDIQSAKSELAGMKNSRGGDPDEISQLEKELRTKMAVSVIMIGKLRAVALAPQIDWIGQQTTDEENEDKYKSPLQQLIHIKEPYKGGPTPKQQKLMDELKRRVALGEQAYTICDFPAFNRQILKPFLDKEGITCEVIDGAVSMGKRNDILERYRKKEISVLLATIGTFDVGINIPDANYCAIIMPVWNFSDAQQSYSRFIRPQSKGERTVDFYILKNSIETYVRQLMDMKKVNMEYVLDYGPRPPEANGINGRRRSSKCF